jgi:hypothetical protein
MKKLFDQIFASGKLMRCMLVAIIPAFLFYCISLVGLIVKGFGILEILRDPAQQSGASSFLGFLSNIGIWLWVSAAAICFFTVLTSDFADKNSRKELLFLTGMLSIMLAFDDFFMIHDRYIDQNICYLAYAVFAGILLWRHHKIILEIEGLAFLTTGALLALSIFTDLAQEHIPINYQYLQVMEEGFKFIGAATWLYFNCRVASYHPTPALANRLLNDAELKELSKTIN